MKSKNLPYYFGAIITGLLSSSCCIIQLILNMFSVGCAGFSILTPFRSIFLSFTVIFFLLTIKKFGIKSKQTINTLIISLLLCFSPEFVSFYNEGNIKLINVNTVPEKEIFILEIRGIGCEGCANKIKKFLDSRPNVIDSKLFFNNKSAVVSVIPGIYKASDLESWIKVVDLKYEGKVIQQFNIQY
ncbi:717_t:CDS:1 [Diversispora eburnea]|uniref:717_t:CDS:1 n=1 Tax=Diversispora eburnea TaxID=1213867 RepID=A0A9N8VJP3_9GLOM|nr:717_t:CDS:1 [Diversispora eburnea]